MAAGDRAGTAWTLSATSAGDGTVTLTLDIGDTSESLAWVAGGDGPVGDDRLSFPISYGQPERAVFAASEPGPDGGQVARITIEGASIIGFVPVEDEATFAVIAYDDGDREIQRSEFSRDDLAGL